MGFPSDYEELLQASPQSSIYATRWWLDAVAPGAHRVLEVRNQGGLRAAWPVVFYDEEDGARHVQMPSLSQKLGIIFAPLEAKPAELLSTKQRLTEELIEQLGDFETFDQNFHEAYTDWLPFLWRGYSQTTRYTYVFEDVGDEAGLWSGIRTQYRRHIRRASSAGLKTQEIDLDRFLAVWKRSFERQGLAPLATDDVVARLDDACGANAERRIVATIDNRGRVHAAIYVVWWNGVAYCPMGGGDPELRGQGGHILALWETVKLASQAARRIDLGGSVLPQVEPVFRGFGATQVPYFAISKSRPPPTSLGDFVKRSVAFRFKRLRRLLTAASTRPIAAGASTNRENPVSSKG